MDFLWLGTIFDEREEESDRDFVFAAKVHLIGLSEPIQPIYV